MVGREPFQRRRFHPLREHRPKRDKIGVDPAMRLRVRMVSAEQRAGEFVYSRLDDIDVVASRIQTMTRRALGVLVAQPIPHSQQDRRTRIVLTRDQLQVRPLINQLLQDGIRDRWIDARDRVERRGEANRVARHALDADTEPSQIGLQESADGHRGSSLHHGPGVRHDSEDAPRWSIPPHNASHDLTPKRSAHEPTAAVGPSCREPRSLTFDDYFCMPPDTEMSSPVTNDDASLAR